MLYSHAANVPVLAERDRLSSGVIDSAGGSDHLSSGVTEEALGKLSIITLISNKALGDRKNWRFLRQQLASNFTPKRANPTKSRCSRLEEKI